MKLIIKLNKLISWKELKIIMIIMKQKQKWVKKLLIKYETHTKIVYILENYKKKNIKKNCRRKQLKIKKKN